MKTRLLLFAIASLAMTSAACSGQSGSDTADPAQSQDITSASASSSKLVVDCDDNQDNEADIEGLEIVRKSGKLTATLTVSGVGDFIESYAYRVTEDAAADSAQDPSAKVLHTFTGTNFKLQVIQGTSLMTAIGPKSATLFPGEKVTAKLACKVSL
jgi:hypothetical protein